MRPFVKTPVFTIEKEGYRAHDRLVQEKTPHPASYLGHLLPWEAVSELAKSQFLEPIINNLRCAKV
jgi:hypothetical protein